MKKTLFILLLTISLVAVALKFVDLIPSLLGVKEMSGLRVFTSVDGADLYIDQKLVGKTPFQSDNLEAKEVNIKIQSDMGVWEGKVKLGAHTVTFVNRNLDSNSLAGEILTLEKGKIFVKCRPIR